MIKRQVLKYGGGKLLAKATPLFIGLFAGQFAIAGVFLVVGWFNEEMRFNVL